MVCELVFVDTQTKMVCSFMGTRRIPPLLVAYILPSELNFEVVWYPIGYRAILTSALRSKLQARALKFETVATSTDLPKLVTIPTASVFQVNMYLGDAMIPHWTSVASYKVYWKINEYDSCFSACSAEVLGQRTRFLDEPPRSHYRTRRTEGVIYSSFVYTIIYTTLTSS